ncbi:hypothetical protein DPMN_092247 [Dreissena polymorpha]|uniref:Uncharacterized protein n=1 Tax=Dreissena polymorpha TaxID=45954 RepID=A0A9D4L1W3_DREPO|nr:hypothetical protein DPMN_092247 [Dreissena polymorpha]
MYRLVSCNRREGIGDNRSTAAMALDSPGSYFPDCSQTYGCPDPIFELDVPSQMLPSFMDFTDHAVLASRSPKHILTCYGTFRDRTELPCGLTIHVPDHA